MLGGEYFALFFLDTMTNATHGIPFLSQCCYMIQDIAYRDHCIFIYDDYNQTMTLTLYLHIVYRYQSIVSMLERILYSDHFILISLMNRTYCMFHARAISRYY